MDIKKYNYVILGGAAFLAAAASLVYYVTSSNEVEEQEEIEEVEVEREENGKITFECFIEIFKISSRHAKKLFKQQKNKYIKERRQAQKDNDEKKYQEIVELMTQEEERLINEKLMEIIERQGISEKEFQETTMYHSNDQRKVIMMMNVQKQCLIEEQTLSREKCIEYFIIQQELQLQMMESMMRDQLEGLNPQTQEGQIRMVMKAMVQQSKIQDKFFEITGVEENQLTSSLQVLQLENDTQFQQIARKYLAMAMNKAYDKNNSNQKNINLDSSQIW